MKSSFGKMYASYVLSIIFGNLMPELLMKQIVPMGSLPYTMAFSNVPGIIKPLKFKGHVIESMTSFIIPGTTGIGLGALSFSGKFVLTMTTDESIGMDIRELITNIE